MGEVIDIGAELRTDNPGVSEIMLEMLSDALWLYAKAANNVRENGAIVAHPRTGAPIENPYLRVMNTQARYIGSNQGINADRVFALIRAGKSSE